MQPFRTHCPVLLYLVASAFALTPSPAQPPTTRPAKARPAAFPLLEKLRALAKQKTITVAHRGDSGSKPENTIPAFAAAVATGAQMVELDFHTTKDGVLVCIHDKTLDRTTDSVHRLRQEKLRVVDYTLAELRKLDAGTWKGKEFAGTRIPTLEAALRTIQPGSITMIEHKRGKPKTLVKLLQRMKLVDRVLVQSFDWAFLEKVRRLEPRLTLAALGGTKRKPRLEEKALARIRKTGAVMVHWSFKRLRAEDVRRLHAEGYLVCVYTVDDVDDYDKAVEMGIDAITTNQPARLIAHVTRRRKGAEKR